MAAVNLKSIFLLVQCVSAQTTLRSVFYRMRYASQTRTCAVERPTCVLSREQVYSQKRGVCYLWLLIVDPHRAPVVLKRLKNLRFMYYNSFCIHKIIFIIIIQIHVSYESTPPYPFIYKLRKLVEECNNNKHMEKFHFSLDWVENTSPSAAKKHHKNSEFTSVLPSST